MLNIQFKKSDLSEVDYDMIALDRVSPKLLSLEPQLAASCWFDYREMHPTKRSYLFAHFYDQTYRLMLRTHVDHRQVEGDNPRSYFPKDDPLGKTKSQLSKEAKSGKVSAFKTMTMIWKARQKADELCIPYDEFCNAGAKAAVGAIWQRMPNPSQLYSSMILDAIVERWATKASETIQAAQSSFYTLQNWTGHPSQIEHAMWLIEQIKCRSNRAMMLAQFGFITPMIPPQLLRDNFDERTLSEALSLGRRMPFGWGNSLAPEHK